jgi:hypothetical protein
VKTGLNLFVPFSRFTTDFNVRLGGFMNSLQQKWIFFSERDSERVNNSADVNLASSGMYSLSELQLLFYSPHAIYKITTQGY